MEDAHQTASAKDEPLSPACSFEVLDPHDPVLSRLATLLFMKVKKALHGEMAAGEDHYALLEEMNSKGITKFADLRNYVSNLTKTVNEYTKLCEQEIKPLLDLIDEMDDHVTRVEQMSYQLVAFIKQLTVLYEETLD